MKYKTTKENKNNKILSTKLKGNQNIRNQRCQKTKRQLKGQTEHNDKVVELDPKISDIKYKRSHVPKQSGGLLTSFFKIYRSNY